MKTCSHCWNPINWTESFNKFGHDDGDDCVHTTEVAQALRTAGYYVKVDDETIHNPIILEIGEEGEPGELAQFYAQDIPVGNVPGYTDPHTVLPDEVVALLNRVFGVAEFLG